MIFFWAVSSLSLFVPLSSSGCLRFGLEIKMWHSCHVYGETACKKASHPHLHPCTRILEFVLNLRHTLKCQPLSDFSAQPFFSWPTQTHLHTTTQQNKQRHKKPQSCFFLILVFLLLFLMVTRETEIVLVRTSYHITDTSDTNTYIQS